MELCSQLCSELLARRVGHDAKSPSHLGTATFTGRKRGDMNTLRRLRNFWIPAVATIVLGCFSDAIAQIRLQNYRFGH